MAINDEYKSAYMAGYMAGKESAETEARQPYLDRDGIIARYGGKIGINKAMEIIRSVRHVCGGGKLNSASLVLVSEIEYWESLVDKSYKKVI